MDINSAVREAAKRLPEIECRYGEPLAAHTSLRIGGPVAAMFLPDTEDRLLALLRETGARGLSPLIIGNGANLLADSRGFDAAAIKTRRLDGVELTPSGAIRAGAGATLRSIAAFARDCGLCGIEFAHGIPGTLGGAVVMNAGAYGGELGDVVETVRAAPRSGENSWGRAVDIPAAECGFGYRSSRFGWSGEIIISADIRLHAGDAAEISAKMERLAARRRDKQPLDEPSAGSAFKRPENGYAAELIDRAGLKGYAIGGAAVSERHAGFIVNRSGATSDDVLELLGYVRARVMEKFGIELEPEIKILRRDVTGGALLWNF
ncbi:MAG: UDP-N-acetylmuramate dehydrogenase [Oscillospiraceae bacterium]|jgi:UDP-N-acetylmuramate dehydrogenase|nr:UDP-N-acetylmuramate dehydrogenase [Oscillospiraceae bacterium]